MNMDRLFRRHAEGSKPETVGQHIPDVAEPISEAVNDNVTSEPGAAPETKSTAEQIEEKRVETMSKLAEQFGMNETELKGIRLEKVSDPDVATKAVGFKIDEVVDMISGKVNGMEIIATKGSFKGNWDKGYRAKIEGSGSEANGIEGEAAESIYNHFLHILNVRDGRINKEAADDAYDAHRIEVVAKVVGGEDRAKKLLGIREA